MCDFGFAKKKAIAVGARFGACDLEGSCCASKNSRSWFHIRIGGGY